MIDHHISQNDHIAEEDQFNKIRDIKGAIMTNANEIQESLIQNYKTWHWEDCSLINASAT